MKRFLRHRVIIISALFLSLLGSCFSLDTEPVYFSDAYIISRIIDGDTLFALDAQAQSNLSLSKVTLTSDHLTSPIELKSIIYTNTAFEHTTAIENYQTQLPVAGNYTFNYTLKDGTTYSEIDIVKTKWIKPFEIGEITYNPNEMSVTFDWPDVADANFYQARLLRNDTVVFFTGMIHKDFSSIKLYTASNGWISSYLPQKGDSLKFLVLAILAEDKISNILEIQSISFSDKKVFVWGE